MLTSEQVARLKETGEFVSRKGDIRGNIAGYKQMLPDGGFIACEECEGMAPPPSQEDREDWPIETLEQLRAVVEPIWRTYAPSGAVETLHLFNGPILQLVQTIERVQYGLGCHLNTLTTRQKAIAATHEMAKALVFSCYLRERR